MRNKISLLAAVFMMTLFCSGTPVSKVDVQGTWKLLESSGNPLPAGFEQIKLDDSSLSVTF